MTKAMTAGEKRRAKKAHANFMAGIVGQPAPEGPTAAIYTPPAPAAGRMKPTKETRAQAAYEEVRADTEGAKHYRRRHNCLLDVLEARKSVTKQQAEAGRRYDVDHRLVWGTAGRDSTIPPIGGVVHETDAQADRIIKAKARMNRVLNMVGPAAFKFLRSVAAFDQPIGRQDSKAQVERYALLKLALDAAAEVYGVAA